MSSKNKLQEFFQKKNLPLPIYHTNRTGGKDNDPRWICTVKLCNDEIICSEPFSNKKACELDAASKALLLIESHDNQLYYKNEKHIFDIKSTVIILVDGENKPVIPIKFINEVSTSASLIVYISKGHPNKPKFQEHEIKIIEVDSTRKDAVDIAIVMDSARIHTDHIIIVTGDHFGATLVEILNKESEHLSKQPPGHLARTYEELLNILEELKNI